MRGQDEILGVAVVCVLTSDESPFDDNDVSVCHFCQTPVLHRPHIPTPHTLVCRVCFVSRMEDGEIVAIAAQSLEELMPMFDAGPVVH